MYRKLVGDWERWEEYPISVAESMGSIIGNDFVIVSGFSGNFNSVTKKVFAIDVKNVSAKWREMDEVPVQGFHHAAFAVDGLVMYICGAYSGGLSILKDSPVCLKYNHTAPPGLQWSRLPDLPEGRGGGGMNLIVETNSLVYATGATRPPTVDHNTTWELFLNNITAGWFRRADIPYQGNHISHVTVNYQGRSRYYYLGGQKDSKEAQGNLNDLFEWDQGNKSWIRRMNLPFPRGHTSASTVAYGCGFLSMGGAINSATSSTVQTANITYYGVDTDSWSLIGNLPKEINTPVCVIVRNVSASDWIYCQTGNVGGSFPWKRRISL
jgi:N-acetylneuraminic acid mutarotase